VVAAARFKVPAGVNEPRLAAYTVYAHYLALLVLRACERPAAAVPSDPSALRSEITDRYGSLSLESALRYTWQAGIPVLPLADPGAFHGAMWRVHGRNVIVLKQTTGSRLRWLFDLLHEVKHALSAPNEIDLSIIELDPLANERKHSDEEEEASQFAGDVLLDGRAEELVELCVRLAKGEVRQLKAAVRTIAGDQAVSQDALANYLAYRLSLQDINWWGAAANLQTEVGNPWRIARDLLFQHVDFKPLGDADRELLRLALSDQSGGSDA
jgi:Zn-dependent peptidase ImmA (M78 family)